ncbi:hypothetical protein [Pectobacterium versatile]|uniref:hypothetical protein n=1 Tax=Pectobacterium versatile TaxID=2488639 RepID=UPI0032EE6F8E
MSFPYIFRIMMQGYLLYTVCMALVKHSKFWHGVWHKPMFSFSIYMLSLSLNYWL